MYSSGRDRSASMMGNSTYSSSTNRRDVLWNVVQPGDPYDIRKSMIAQLPGGDNSFMGEHLEIVCLMQSAEIERLCEFLDDYKYRYREMERKQLDRHSYEIQIKQLTQRLSDESGFRSQNQKLKDFIKKLTQENQDLKGNKYTIDSSLKTNYQNALLNIDNLTRENDHLRSENSTLLLQSNSYLAKIDAIEAAKQRELKELFDRYASDSSRRLQIQTSSISVRYQSEISRLQMQVKRLKQFNETKNEEVNQLSNKNRKLVYNIEDLQKRLSQQSTVNNREVEERFTLFGQQIERLNLVLRESTAKLDEASRNQLLWQQKYHRIEMDLRNYEQNNKNLEEQIFQLNGQLERSRFQVNQSQSLQYQDEIHKLKNQIHHLQNDRTQINKKFTLLQRQFSQLEYQVNKTTIIQKQNFELKTNMTNYQQLQRRVSQYQNKIALLSQEIQRLTNNIANYQQEKRQYLQVKNQFEDYRRKSIDQQRTITQQYQRDMQNRIMEYETKIQQYAEQTGQEFDMRVQNMAKQMDNLKKYLNEKTEEAENHKRRIRELENTIHSKYQVETNRKITTYQTTITELKAYSEDLSRKYRDLEMNNRRIPEYQNKIAIQSQEIERLNQSLRSLTNEDENLRRQLRELEIKFTNTSNMQEMETSRKFSMYEENQSRLNRQNEDLRRKLQQIVELKRVSQQLERKLMLSSQQMQRLDGALKSKVEALNNSENNVRKLTIQLQNMRRAGSELENNWKYKFESVNMEASRKVTSFEQNLTHLQRQNQELKRRLNQFTNEHNRRMAEYQNKIAILKEQNERLNGTLKNTMSETDKMGRNMKIQFDKITSENQHLKTTIMKYEESLNKLNRQNQQLRRALQEKEMAFKNIYSQYENFRVQVKQFEGQVTYQNSNVSRQLQQTKRNLFEYENRLKQLSQENERISRNSQQEKEKLNRIIMEMQNELNNRHETTTKFEMEASRKISTYEQNINVVVRERDQLKRVMVEYENKMNSLVREIEDSHRKNNELENKYRQLGQEHQVWRSKYQELEYNVTHKYEVETTRKITSYEQNLQNQGRQIEQYKVRINEYESMRVKYEQEIQNMGREMQNMGREIQNLKSRIVEYENMRKGYEQNNVKTTHETEQLVRKIRELQSTITQKYEVQTTRKFGMYEQNINQLNAQNEQLRKSLTNSNREIEEMRRILKEHGDLQRIISDYDRQILTYKQDIERLNGLLQRRNEEFSQLEQKYRQDTEALRRQLQETQISITNNYNQKASGYQQNLTMISRENEELKKRLNDMAQEMERLNNNLRAKVEQLKQTENKVRNLQQELQNMHRKMQEMEINSKKMFDTEFSRTTSMYEQKTTTITREYQNYVNDSKRKYAEYENKIALMSQQLERLTSGLNNKNEESRQLDGQVRNLKLEIERLNRSVHEQEQMNSKRFETELSRTVSTYESKFTTVTRQYDEYRRVNERKVGDLETKYHQLQSQIEIINGILRQKTDQNRQLDINLKQASQELDILRKKIQETEHSWSQRYEMQVNRTTSTYQQNISGLRNNINQYQRKLNQLNRKIAEDQNKIAVRGQEIERLTQTLRTKTDENSHLQMEIQKYRLEIENLKGNISGHYAMEIEKLSHTLRQKDEENLILQQKISSLQSNQDGQYRQLQNSYTLMTKEYENSKKHLIEYEQSIKKLYSEFERLQIIINELKAQRQSLFEKNHGLLQEIERLTELTNDQQGQLSQLRLRLTDEVALQKRINEHMALMVVLFAEIETLRQRVKDKEKEVKEVRRSSLAPFKA